MLLINRLKAKAGVLICISLFIVSRVAATVESCGDSKELPVLQRVVIEEGVQLRPGDFHGCTSLVEVVIHSQIKEIPKGAFSSCPSLERVVLPDCIEVIKGGAFSGCASLEVVRLPRATRIVDPNSFRKCFRLREFQIPADNNYLKTVGGIVYSKDGTKLLLSPCRFELGVLDIPEGVQTIAPQQFCDTRGLKVVKLPASVVKIGELCFAGESDIESFDVDVNNQQFFSCEGLLYAEKGRILRRCPPAHVRNTIRLFRGTKSMEAFAFQGSRAEEIVFPVGMNSFPGRWALYGCANLRKVIIPDTLADIGVECFSRCPLLTDICVQENGGCLKYKEGLLYDTCRNELLYCAPSATNCVVRLPNGTVSVKEGAFANLTKKCRVEFPASLRRVCMFEVFLNPACSEVVFEGDCPDGFAYIQPNHHCVLYIDSERRSWKCCVMMIKQCHFRGMEIMDLKTRRPLL